MADEEDLWELLESNDRHIRAFKNELKWYLLLLMILSVGTWLIVDDVIQGGYVCTVLVLSELGIIIIFFLQSLYVDIKNCIKNKKEIKRLEQVLLATRLAGKELPE